MLAIIRWWWGGTRSDNIVAKDGQQGDAVAAPPSGDA